MALIIGSSQIITPTNPPVMNIDGGNSKTINLDLNIDGGDSNLTAYDIIIDGGNSIE
jgi:hypothetical protein